MSRGKIILGLITLVVVGVIIFTLVFKPQPAKEESIPAPNSQDEKLKIIKTNPELLDDTTILPTQSIEITFNKVVPKSEFKHLLAPEVKNYEIEALGGPDSSKGTTMKINFKDPLQLGGGYSLIIYESTRAEKESDKLDKEYIYHFKTIKYKGV